MKYTTHYQTRITSQSQAIPGKEKYMHLDVGGGYVFTLDKWKLLDRFLILGSEGGTFYVSEQKLTRDNARNVLSCIEEDGKRVVDKIVEISESGRAPKNDPALFVLALCAKLGNDETRKYAYANMKKIVRIGTHLFKFVAMAEDLGGWSRGLRNAVIDWYNRNPDRLAYQVLKYRQRDGWSHKDLLRLAHPKPINDTQAAIFRWIVKGESSPLLPQLITDFTLLQNAKTEEEVIALLDKNEDLTWEMIQTDLIKSKKIWERLLPNMLPTAMMRNLGRMTNYDVLTPFSDYTGVVIDKLKNTEELKEHRVHPFECLLAGRVYASGRGVKGDLKWSPVSEIVDALNEAFYATFDCVEPTYKKLLIGIDVSGSMWDKYKPPGTERVANVPGFYPAEAAAAMAVMLVNTEPKCHIIAFDTKYYDDLSISPKQRINDIIQKFDKFEKGGTDCSLPILYALMKNYNVDAIVILTDDHTWYGNGHPSQWMNEYRRRVNPKAKLITVGMTSENAAIVDPLDMGMLQIVGFDASIPKLINDFIRE